MKSEHLIKMRGGNEHLAYPGLLDEAWKNWLRGIDTEIIQVPTPDNGNLAIVKAVATFDDPEDPSGQPKSFSGIGDASPESVGSKNMIPHILRLAETRAKARSLRDGVNIGAIDFEDGETHGEVRQGVRHKPEEKSGEVVDEKPLTENQLKAIHTLLHKLEWDRHEFEQNHVKTKELTTAKASEIIVYLQNQLKRKEKEAS